MWAVGAMVCFAGCDDPSRSPIAANGPAPAQQKPTAKGELPETSAAPTLAVSVDASGRKWIAPGVPYDVFPDLPSEAEIAAAASVAPAGEEMPAPSEPASEAVASIDHPSSTPIVPPSESPAGPTSGTSSWEEILPREHLLNEVASLRNEIGEGLLTVGNYNSAFEQVSHDAWVMSALATIVSESADEISWKANALLARDTAQKLAGSAMSRGRENFKQAEAAKEELFAVLNNNTPPGLPEPDPEASREETADRAALMTRMQSSFDHLKSFAGNDAELTKNAATAGQEARVLAALAKFTSHKDYGGTGNDDYQEFAKVLVDGGLEIAKAAGAQDAATFKTELDRIGTACNNCHQKYRFESN